DPTVLQNPVVAKGVDAQTATLLPNTLTAGKIGVILAYPVGTAIPAGNREIITVTFNVAPDAPAGATPVTFSDTPVIREISDVEANVLESTFTGGTVTILAPTSAPVMVAGRVLRT